MLARQHRSSNSAAMAYQRACLMLLLLSAYLCFRAFHAAALSFSYDFSKPGDLDRANLTYFGDSSNSGDRVNLTKLTTWSTGRVAYPQPVRLWDDRTGKRASFTTDFSFAIPDDGKGNDRGDGMAFFVGTPDLPPDSNGGFLGLFSNKPSSPPQTVGVEFDTCKNEGDVVRDPPDVTADHIGIDINSIISKNYTSLPNLKLSGTMSASITYDGGSKIMSVSLWVGDSKSNPYSVKAQVDLRDAGVPRDAAVGFSAATGNLTESHQLLSWSFSSTDSSKLELWVIILIALASASVASIAAALLYLFISRQRRAPKPSKTELAPKIELAVAREIPYDELSTATNNFSEDRKLGEGNFGVVYRGELRDPRMRPVAVKKLRDTRNRTRRDYVTEIMTLGELSFRNLVKLVGWCDDGDQLLLVYELVTNKSLDDHLHGSSSSSERLLTWSERYRIVLGIGSAIQYLHTGNENTILHRDIKPSNVMLDDNFVAKLGDFGLVRQVKPGQGGSLRDTIMVGSWDYMDPVCMTTGSASTASDMYSFGVLLLEIATGMKPQVVVHDEKRGLTSNILVNAVRESYGKGAVLEMADARLKGDFDKNQMERVMLVGLLCVHQDRGNRLEIKEAVDLLSNLKHPLPETQVVITT